MKTFPGLLPAEALACTASPEAWAYKLSPPDVSARLHGKLTFTPNEGSNTHSFKCGVTLDLKTKGGKIKSIKFTHGNCEDISFQNLPWTVYNLTANSGDIGFVSYGSAKGNCQQIAVQFQDNPSGIWTLPAGQCLSGTLTSSPPVTIVP